MKKLLEMTDGWKTHGIVLIGVISLIAVNMLGWEIPGVPPNEDWVTQLLALLGLSGLRRGMKE